jgi:hypothetical protein
MAIVEATHLRFAWFEYEDWDDAVAFTTAFSQMGWRNVLGDLGQIGPGPPQAFDQGHLDLFIKWVPNSTSTQRGLIAFPADQHASFLARWLFCPAVNSDTSKLTLDPKDDIDSDDLGTRHAELVSISGHHSGGRVSGQALKNLGKGVPSGINLGQELRTMTSPIVVSGHLKYLLIPACYACNLDQADEWLPFFQQNPSVHGILGYSNTYIGDKTGAILMRDFALEVKRNPSGTILDAWRRANASAAWGAVMHNGALTDTPAQWATDDGLPRLGPVGSGGSARVLQFDPANFASGGQVVQVGTPDFQARFHRGSDGKEIKSGNNDVTGIGLNPGTTGFILIKANNGKTFSQGDKITLVFFYYRPLKHDMNLDTLLTFSSSLLQTDPTLGVPKLRVIPDANVQKEGWPNKRNDGVEYTFGSEQEGRIDYTVNQNAASSYPAGPEGPNTHGRFMLYVFPPGASTSNPQAGFSMYHDGVWLFQ